MIKEIDRDFTKEEILEIINKLPTGKACGPDGIKQELIKVTKQNIVNKLVKIFNEQKNKG